MSGLIVTILAAGGATRFGGGKLDADLLGKPLGRYSVEAALPLGLPNIVITRPPPFFASDAFAMEEAILLNNKRAAEGLGTSVALAAMQAAASNADALLLLAADMPLVTSATLQRLVEAVAPGHPSSVVHPDGTPGIPACFPANYFPALARLAGDKGAGAILQDAEGVRLVKADARELRDVDTREALAQLVSELGG